MFIILIDQKVRKCKCNEYFFRKRAEFVGGERYGRFVHSVLKPSQMAVVKTVCPKKRDIFKYYSLLARSIIRRTEEMSENLKPSKNNYFKKLQFFAIAIDESADTTDSAQLAIFVRKIKEDFHVLGEFVELIFIKNTRTGVDILRPLLTLKLRI